MKNVCTTKRTYASLDDNSRPDHADVAVLFKRWQEKLARYSIYAAFPTIMASTLQDTRAEERTLTNVDIAGQTSEPLYRRRGRNRSGLDQNEYRLAQQMSFESVLGGNDDCPGKPIPPGTYTAAAPYTDTGNTTGANNTVNSFFYYYGYYEHYANAPDHVYSFTLTGRGANPRIEVIAANPDSYKPFIYLTANPYWGGCPAGTGNILEGEPLTWDEERYPWGDGIIQLDWPDLNKRYFLFIDSQLNDSLGSGAYTLKLQDVTIARSSPPTLDYDGDLKTDLSIFRPSNGMWSITLPRGGFKQQPWGVATDRIAPADYDGDGKTDIAVYRPVDGDWWVLNSQTSTFSVQRWGDANDVIVPADYTGDGKAELAVWRPSGGNWWIRDISNGQYQVINWGISTDKPVPADYDGDGKTDIAVYRPSDGTWWVIGSQTGGISVRHWGDANDKLVPADYTGDGKAEFAVWRPSEGNWWVLNPQTGTFSITNWGISTDLPVPADYDGNGRADIAVWRPADGVWWILNDTGGGYSSTQWGAIGDRPTPNAFVR